MLKLFFDNIVDDAWKSVGWNISGYDNGCKSWKEGRKRQRWPVWPDQGPSDGYVSFLSRIQW